MPGNRGFLYKIALLTVVISNYVSLNGKRLDVSNACRMQIDLDRHGNKWCVRARDEGTMARERLSIPPLNAVDPLRNDDVGIAVTRDPRRSFPVSSQIIEDIQRSLSR